MALASYRVLICEDDPAMVRIFQFLLQKQGIGPLLTVSDGKKVVALIEREKPHLVLLDLMLPGKDGITILKELKKSPATSAIPVVVISGIESQNQVTQAIDAGAADYVTKPFDSMELGSRIKQFLISLYNPSTNPESGMGTPPQGMASGGSF
jgi:DNA-binding response OmpR family regulator